MNKKITLLIAIIFATCASAFAQNQMVTFQVESPDSTPVYVFGSWSSWGNWPGNPMTMVAPGKYSATISIASNTTFEYKFVNGSTPVLETLNPSWTCTNGNAQYTNRVVAIGAVDTAMCHTWSSCSNCTVTPPPPPPQLINVTFQVDMPDSTPVHVQGSWNWSSFPGAVMTLAFGTTYSTTIQLMPNSPYEFKFNNGVGPTFEILNPSWPCTNGNSQYTNRTLVLGANDTSICFKWSTCTTCPITPPPANVNITLQVEQPDSTPVFVFGSWNNWSNWPGTPTTMVAPGIYEATVAMPANATYEYLFVNGNAAKEALNSAWPCTNGNTQYTNRMLPVAAVDFTKCSKWAKCDSCGPPPPPPLNVKFAVQATDSTPVYVFGSWSNWSNFPGNPMTLNTATGAYEVILPQMAGSTIEYLYVNGVGTKEALNSAWACTNGNTQYTNRKVTLGTTDTAFCNRWATCTACFPLSISNTKLENVNVMVSNNFVSINTNTLTQVDGLEIYDATGRIIYASNGKVKTNQNVSVNLQNNALYIIRVKNGDAFYKVKAVIKN
jgi:hypothetical protein